MLTFKNTCFTGIAGITILVIHRDRVAAGRMTVIIEIFLVTTTPDGEVVDLVFTRMTRPRTHRVIGTMGDEHRYRSTIGSVTTAHTAARVHADSSELAGHGTGECV